MPLDPILPLDAFHSLSAAARRRHRHRLLWVAAAGVVATAWLLTAWEAFLGGGGPAAARPWGYLAVVLAVTVASWGLVRGWRASAPAAEAIADALERLFPQARGRVRDSLATTEAGRGLVAARAAFARGWVAGRGTNRLDVALAACERPAARRARWLTAGALVLLLLAAGLDPGAARRAAVALSAPSHLWSDGAGAWQVEPGDARVPYGAPVDGRARFGGPTAGGGIVLEWIEIGGSWRADTLAAGSVGIWRWERVTTGRRYRLRVGDSASREYRIEVGLPLALERVEARRPGGAWEPIAGRVVRAGEPLEIRGWASAPLATAEVVPDGGGEGIDLDIEDKRLTGIIRPTAGDWRIALQAFDGTTVLAAPFRAVRPGEAYVILLRPAEDPVYLAATSAWIEARVGGPDGIRAVVWETTTGSARRGPLGDPRGARDTVLASVAPIAQGLGAGDTVRFRVVAFPVDGSPVASAWRTGVVADAASLREEAGATRATAVQAVERAAEEARQAADRSPAEATEAEERLQRAADSLAAAVERTLSDPALPPETRERLEAYRDMLAGLADAELARSQVPGPLPPDPAASARARAELLSEIAAAVQRAEELAARTAAADSLSQLADAERALANDTRGMDAERMAAEIGDRQEAVASAARETAEPLPADAAASIERALEEAARRIEGDDPASAADAQNDAASAMDAAAAVARAQSVEETARNNARRAAVDRAAGETLFLAERQRAVAQRLATPTTGGGDQADRVARQRVVVQGLDRTLAALIEAIGGRPAAAELARLLAESVYATRRAEGMLTSGTGTGRMGDRRARAAADEAAGSLALLARAFLLPPGSIKMGGAQGSSAESGSLARQLDAMASAQRSIADAAARTDDPAGGNPEAAAAERQLGRELGGIEAGLEAQGIDARAVGALLEAVESAARQLERGLPGAREETELRSLARRFADMGRMVQQQEGERRAEAARGFVPTTPPPLPARATARRLDPEAALAPWAESLPRPALAPARAYLERLADEGVRATGGEP